jgi:hypothetical protein
MTVTVCHDASAVMSRQFGGSVRNGLAGVGRRCLPRTLTLGAGGFFGGRHAVRIGRPYVDRTTRNTVMDHERNGTTLPTGGSTMRSIRTASLVQRVRLLVATMVAVIAPLTPGMAYAVQELTDNGSIAT